MQIAKERKKNCAYRKVQSSQEVAKPRITFYYGTSRSSTCFTSLHYLYFLGKALAFPFAFAEKKLWINAEKKRCFIVLTTVGRTVVPSLEKEQTEATVRPTIVQTTIIRKVTFFLTLTPMILQASRDLGLVRTKGHSSGTADESKFSRSKWKRFCFDCRGTQLRVNSLILCFLSEIPER